MCDEVTTASGRQECSFLWLAGSCKNLGNDRDRAISDSALRPPFGGRYKAPSLRLASLTRPEGEAGASADL